MIGSGSAVRLKNLRNALGAGLKMRAQLVEAALAAAGIDPANRAERLGAEDFVRLARAIETVNRAEEPQKLRDA